MSGMTNYTQGFQAPARPRAVDEATYNTATNPMMAWDNTATNPMMARGNTTTNLTMGMYRPLYNNTPPAQAPTMLRGTNMNMAPQSLPPTMANPGVPDYLTPSPLLQVPMMAPSGMPSYNTDPFAAAMPSATQTMNAGNVWSQTLQNPYTQQTPNPAVPGQMMYRASNTATANTAIGQDAYPASIPQPPPQHHLQAPRANRRTYQQMNTSNDDEDDSGSNPRKKPKSSGDEDRVRCQYARQGCPFEGTDKDVKRHLSRGCKKNPHKKQYPCTFCGQKYSTPDYVTLMHQKKGCKAIQAQRLKESQQKAASSARPQQGQHHHHQQLQQPQPQVSTMFGQEPQQQGNPFTPLGYQLQNPYQLQPQLEQQYQQQQPAQLSQASQLDSSATATSFNFVPPGCSPLNPGDVAPSQIMPNTTAQNALVEETSNQFQQLEVSNTTNSDAIEAQQISMPQGLNMSNITYPHAVQGQQTNMSQRFDMSNMTYPHAVQGEQTSLPQEFHMSNTTNPYAIEGEQISMPQNMLIATDQDGYYPIDPTLDMPEQLGMPTITTTNTSEMETTQQLQQLDMHTTLATWTPEMETTDLSQQLDMANTTVLSTPQIETTDPSQQLDMHTPPNSHAASGDEDPASLMSTTYTQEVMDAQLAELLRELRD